MTIITTTTTIIIICYNFYIIISPVGTFVLLLSFVVFKLVAAFISVYNNKNVPMKTVFL